MCGLQWCSGTENLVGSLWFSPGPVLGPQALVLLALDERTQAEGLVLAGGGLGNRLCVCPSAGLPAWLPPALHPFSSLLCAPRNGQVDTRRHLLEQVSGQPWEFLTLLLGSGIFPLR